MIDQLKGLLRAMRRAGIEDHLKKLYRDTAQLKLGKSGPFPLGATRLGGTPDVPGDFLWPTFETATCDDDTVKARPLSFLAQFDCGQIAPLDGEGLLPKTGLLSFFYELGSQCWGYDPKDAGCSRVFWFEDVSSLHSADFPSDLQADYRLPPRAFSSFREDSLPGANDFLLYNHKFKNMDGFDAHRKALGLTEYTPASKLLGWPDIIQGNMTVGCELVRRNFYLGNGWNDLPRTDVDEAVATSLEQWRLLFQLDSQNWDGFELMFGDCGRIYFYIHMDDLKARRFDQAWLVLQCG